MDAVYNEWENASVIAKMAKDPTAILDDVTRRKEMLEIELQCSNYYLDMSDGVQHPVPKPDYTENIPESFLSSLLKKKIDLKFTNGSQNGVSKKKEPVY